MLNPLESLREAVLPTKITPRRPKAPIQGVRDKRNNSKEFNKLTKKRRKKARFDEINRKKNRKCGYRA
jgi:hypothetical protein